MALLYSTLLIWHTVRNKKVENTIEVAQEFKVPELPGVSDLISAMITRLLFLRSKGKRGNILLLFSTLCDKVRQNTPAVLTYS